jgi:formate dehydrogenase subunit delta
MKIDALIKMANQIAAFFDGEGGHNPEEAAKLMATHLRRYWEPRMRQQMIEYYRNNGGEGLDDLALAWDFWLTERCEVALCAS